MEEALKALFERHFKVPVEKAESLKGDGSDRKLVRLRGGGRSVIGAIGPDPQ